MKKGIKFLASAILALSAVACASVQKMAENAASVKVSCEPAVLQVVAGNINAELTFTYPKGYFQKKAILELTPVLVYQGGEEKMAPMIFQGSKVKDNFQLVSYDGQTVKEKVHFVYRPGMEKATLELRGLVRYKDKSYKLPVRKVAIGCNTTYMLTDTKGTVPFKKDNYQDILHQTAEGQILYNINSANVSSKQLRSSSVKDFEKALAEIASNARKTLTGTEVIAYASPDGGKKLNAKLSEKRAGTASKAFKKITKKDDVSKPEVVSVGQDWKGFQQMVQKSNIPDKDLILRVLSMYSDPAVRETEIKNMSEIYTALKKTVLPELRRARFIANVAYKNYTKAELLKQVTENIDVLDEESLLHAASLLNNLQDKMTLYKKAIEKYNSDRAKFNLGIVYLDQDQLQKAADEFAQVQTKDAALQNALGVVALRQGKLDQAAKIFSSLSSPAAKQNLAVVDILQGKYLKAAELLAGSHTSNEAIVYLLTNQPSKALNSFSCACPKADYIRAIASARLGNKAAVAKYLQGARRCPKLSQRIKNDVEFAKYNVVLK